MPGSGLLILSISVPRLAIDVRVASYAFNVREETQLWNDKAGFDGE
jgi:hypothetical protein